MAAAANNVCDDCWDGRVAIRAALPQLWFGLHNVLAPGSTGMQQEPPATNPVKSKPPLQICVLDTLHEVPTAMAYWANGVLAGVGLPMLEREGLRWGVLLTKAILVLESSDYTLRLHYQARLYLAEMITLSRRMMMLSTLDPLVSRIKAPCPSCSNAKMPLLRDTITQRVVCPACRQGWERESFMAVVMAKAGKG